jgi:hypothetical protein
MQGYHASQARVDITTPTDHDDMPGLDQEYESAAVRWEPTDDAPASTGIINLACDCPNCREPYPDDASDFDLSALEPFDYEPTAEDMAEAERVHTAMACERLLGVELGPTAEDQAWWSELTRDRQPRPAQDVLLGVVPPSDTWKDVEGPRGAWGGHPAEYTL